MNMQIASLIRTDEMEVVVSVLPDDVEWIEEGLQVELKRNNGSLAKGVISRVAGFIDPGSQSVNVYVAVKSNRSIHMLEGEYVEAEFISPETVSGMKIPREALLKEKSIYVLENGHLTIFALVRCANAGNSTPRPRFRDLFNLHVRKIFFTIQLFYRGS